MRFFGGVQASTGAVALWAVVFADAGWTWWALALFGYFLYGCVGLSVGFHRYFARRSFEAPRWAVVMFHLLGIMACIGAAAGRAVTHRRHHVHADRAGDPHPAKALGWRALVVGNYEGGQDRAAVRRELRRDRFGAWLYRRYLPLALGWPVLLLALDWRLTIFLWAVPVAKTFGAGELVTMICHRWGNRRHTTGNDSRHNNPALALLSPGASGRTTTNYAHLGNTMSDLWLAVGATVIRPVHALPVDPRYFFCYIFRTKGMN